MFITRSFVLEKREYGTPPLAFIKKNNSAAKLVFFFSGHCKQIDHKRSCLLAIEPILLGKIHKVGFCLVSFGGLWEQHDSMDVNKSKLLNFNLLKGAAGVEGLE